MSEETWEFQVSDSKLRIVYILGQKMQDVCVRGTCTLSIIWKTQIRRFEHYKAKSRNLESNLIMILGTSKRL